MPRTALTSALRHTGIAAFCLATVAGIAIAAGSSSPTYTQGGYNDLFVMPGTFPNHQVVDLKAKAVRGIRYLTPYNPTCTGAGNPQLAGSVEFYTSYPGTGRILAGSTTTALFVDRIWQHDPTGQTITREATGTTHTITGWGVNYPNPVAPPLQRPLYCCHPPHSQLIVMFCRLMSTS